MPEASIVDNLYEVLAGGNFPQDIIPADLTYRVGAFLDEINKIEVQISFIQFLFTLTNIVLGCKSLLSKGH